METALAEQLFTATITIAHVAEHKAGRKTVGVKDTKGDWYNAWPNKAKDLRSGETYEITFKGDGRYIQSFKHITPNGHQPRAQQQQQRSKSVQQPEAPHNGNGNGNGWYRPTHPRDGERMFVCSVLNAFIQTGRIRDDVAALTKAVNDLRSVWQDTFGLDDQPAG